MNIANPYTILFICITLLFSFVSSQPIEKRTSYNIPLIKLSLLRNKDNSDFKNIRVPINGKKEYAVITEGSDLHITLSRLGKKKIVYAEPSDSRFLLTSLEVKQLKRLLYSLIKTLKLFERDLQKQRWDKCLYLDCFFPKFLKSFYHFNCTALSSTQALPPELNIPDRLFDISLKSEKTDKRIQTWRKNKETAIKLRIALKELIYHINYWQEKELSELSTGEKIEYSTSFKEAYQLFVRLYFVI